MMNDVKLLVWLIDLVLKTNNRLYGQQMNWRNNPSETVEEYWQNTHHSLMFHLVK